MTGTQEKDTPRPSRPGYQHFISAILADRERFFTEVVREEHLARKLRHSILTLLALTAFLWNRADSASTCSAEG